MGYATITQFRTLTNIKKELINDNELLTFFKIGDRLVNKLISTTIKKERISGKIDDSNVDFRTIHAPICDITLKNILILDACDATTDWTASTDATAVTLTGQLVEGYGALALGKDGATTTAFSYTKTITSVDGTGRRLKLSVYITDINELKREQALSIKVGSSDSKTYGIILQRSQLKEGLNEFDFDLVNDMLASGTPDITALVYLSIEFHTPDSADTITHGNIVMDYWRLEDIDSPDTEDVVVYYATNDDTTGFLEYGSSNAITSLQQTEGIITMTTAPSSTTAEAGVYADYSYVSEDMDWNLINVAACYMAAHLCGFKISGNAPDYSAISDAFARRDLAGSPDEWLRLCFSILINAVGEGNTGIGFRRVETRNLT